MHVYNLLRVYPMNVEDDRLVCGRRFPFQLGVVLVYLLTDFSIFVICCCYFHKMNKYFNKYCHIIYKKNNCLGDMVTIIGSRNMDFLI